MSNKTKNLTRKQVIIMFLSVFSVVVLFLIIRLIKDQFLPLMSEMDNVDLFVIWVELFIYVILCCVLLLSIQKLKAS